jgi:tetratricopeptide (TPR) repeat protein
MVKKTMAIIFCFAFLLSARVVYGETPYEKGLKEFKEENFEEALEYFLEARKLDPSSSSAAFFLGLTYKHMQNFKEAIPHFRDAVTLTPKVKEALTELIDVLYLTNELEEAKKWIEVGEKEEVFPAKLQFLKGLVLAKEGKNKEAIVAFEKAKELDKDLTQSVEFHIGNIYIKEGKLKEAKDRFRFALTIDPTTEMGMYARDYEKFLTAKMERERPWRLSFGLAYKYDTNVVLKPTSGLVAESISNAKDNALNGTLRVGYTAPFSFKSPFSLSFQYSLYTDTYAQLTTSNWISSTITAIPGYNFGKFSVSLPLIHGYNWVDRRSYLDLKGVEPTVRIMTGENSIGEVSLSYLRKDYTRHPLDIAEGKDGHTWTGSYGWTYFLKGGEGLMNLKYSPSVEDTEGSNWSYLQHKFSLGFLYPLIWSFKLQLTGEAAPTHYLNRHTVFNKKRIDNIYSGSVGLTYSVLKNLDAIANYSYTRDIANIEIYDYKRHIVSLGLEFRY